MRFYSRFQRIDMHHLSGRCFSTGRLYSLLVAILVLFTFCSKDKVTEIPPKVSLISDSGFVYKDTSLVVGERILVGIGALASGENITFFQVTVDNGKRSILLDSGLNKPSLQYRVNIIKSASSYEKWTFLVMDRHRNKDSVHIVLGKSDSSNYGKIVTYTDVKLGGQDNLDAGSFYCFNGGEIYFLHDAYLNQSKVDLIYYFGQYDATFSSPSEAEAPAYFSGPEGIANWTVKNETRYDTTLLSPQLFDEAADDSLLLAVYEPTAGKRKAKYLEPGMVISFKSPLGKIGLIKVIEAVPGPVGSVKCTIKIQE
jgi:hypothetical protein